MFSAACSIRINLNRKGRKENVGANPCVRPKKDKSNMAEKIQTITQADLIRLEAESDEFSIEVDDGAIVKVEHTMTFFHVLIMQNLYDILVAYIRAYQLGSVFMDGARYILEGDNQDIQRAYKPDLSFVRSGRITADFDWSGDFEGAPDLAVEIASPGQGVPYFVKRVHRFLSAGVEEIWVIYPSRKELYQYRKDADVPRQYGENDTVTTPLFPDLQISVAELFKKEA
jgi:Uma2 family endonuclease